MTPEDPLCGGAKRVERDSLKKRYLYKLGAGFLGMAASGVTQALVPRALGPAAYGDFNFLNNFFSEVAGFLDMGTSLGFYTKLSQRPRDSGLVRFYLIFMIAVCAAISSFTVLACFTPLAKTIWPGQKSLYILMGALLGILLWGGMVINKTTDAYALTVPAEILRVLQKVFGLVFLLLLLWVHQLNLATFFGYQCVLAVLACGGLAWINAHHGYPLSGNLRLSGDQFKRYAREFYHYSHPLFTYSVVGLFSGILGRWLLQVFSGSVEQGFFGFSAQIGAMCFLCANSMTPLLLREFSIAHDRQDLAGMAVMFRKYVPFLYSVTAYFSCFVALHSDMMIRVFGGASYVPAGTAVILMSLFPIHSAYGQMSGSMFLASGRTDIFRNIGIAGMLGGLMLGYFLLAPAESGGLHLGATGLALQTFVTQFLCVNVQLYMNAKYLRLPFLRYLGHQFASVAVLLALAWFSRRAAEGLAGPAAPWFAGFILAGVAYTGAVVLVAWLSPRLFGLSSAQVASFSGWLRQRLA